MVEQVFVRAVILGELPSKQKLISILANNADGIRFYTDENSLVRPPIPGVWVSVENGLPMEARDYLCRCNIDGHDEFPFYMVLRYYLVDKTPHFQHETVHGLHVTHWMAFEPPKVGEGA